MKYFYVLFYLLLCQSAFAKKVKFSVDFGTDSVSILGAHIAGDFQTAIGLQSNWVYDSTRLIQEGTTGIYSIVLDIPAFKRYKYIFINGAFGYEQEIPPLESQVQDSFITYRFMYVDSTANDTTIMPAVRYGMNAPVGKILIRTKVDMSYKAISPKGVHINAGKQGSTKSINRMCPMDNNQYHSLHYVDSAVTIFEYDFINGNTMADAEIKSNDCTNATASRAVIFATDKELNKVCYATCSFVCTPLSNNVFTISHAKIYPNPSNNGVTIISNLNNYAVKIYNMQGQIVYSAQQIFGNCNIAKLPNNGIYVIKLSKPLMQPIQLKMIQQ
jgi:Secretion system C-terminal sorting domain